jgi:protein associated with RNAse G/E
VIPWDEVLRPESSVVVTALKFDRSPSFRWVASVSRVSADELVLLSPGGTEIESDLHGPFCPLFDAETWFWRERWWNVTSYADGPPEAYRYYADVALPPEVAPGVVTYVDLELDVVVRPDLGYEIVDRDEFEEACRTMPIPGDVRIRAEAAVGEIEEMIRRREAPFAPGQSISS